MQSPDIVTDRLRINALTPEDAPTLFSYRSHPAVAQFQDWCPPSIDEARKFILRNLASEFGQNASWYQLAVRAAVTGELLGDLGVRFLGHQSRQVEFGATIAPPYQRQGLGSAAVTALLNYLFEVMHTHRVFASVDPRNEASMALARSVGMREEAHFHQSLWWKDEWVDDVVFGILRTEWKPQTLRQRPAVDRRDGGG